MSEPLTSNQQFTADWFSHNLPTWEKVIAPHLRAIEKPHVLEIGAHEGRASVWFLSNFPQLKLTVVDPWEDGAVLERFLKNCSGYLWRVDINVGTSQESLRGLERDELYQPFNVVYVDGRHTAECVLHDAVLGFELLRDNGLIVFDDYGGGEPGVPYAVNAFASCYGGRLALEADGYQRIYRKVRWWRCVP